MAVTNHQASAQMLGYLYQVRCALDLLLSDTNERLSICIEKFDDIAFSIDGESPSALIQTKHHIKGNGDLSNKSVDLWRTIKVWIDHVLTFGLDNKKFVIITTSSAPKNSAASLLRIDNRNVSRAFELLKQASKQSENKTNEVYYTAFNQIRDKTMQQLLAQVIIVDKSDNILNVVDNIKRLIRYSTRPEFENKVMERIEGWWFEKTVEALSSEIPIFISQGQIRSKIRDVADEYLPDNLPIEIDFFETVDIECLPQNERVFCEQLRLIAVNEKRINLAIRDYYRAFTQRSKWIQDDLLYIDELDKYELRLIDEWEHLFARMNDELDVHSDEKSKQNAGRSLYNQIEQRTDIRIRPRCSDAFVMRGSYHILANDQRVGWHLDFIHRLASILRGGEEL